MLTKTAPDEALVLFEKAIRFDARNANAYCSMGNVFTRRGQFEEAMRCYRQALEVDPALKQAQQNHDIVVRALQRSPAPPTSN
jgi:Flp pilus assembly protein TadD